MDTPLYHRSAVDLFYRLYQVARPPSTCEDILLMEMLSENRAHALEAHRRVITMWHLLRSPAEEQTASGRTVGSGKAVGTHWAFERYAR